MTRRLAQFKEWLADIAQTPEALEWARGLSEGQLEALAEALEEKGYPLDEKGVPVGTEDNGFWDAFDRALDELGI